VLAPSEWFACAVNAFCVFEVRVCDTLRRLKPGVAIAQAQAEMDAIARGLESESPGFQGRGVNLVRLDQEVASKARPALLILLGTVGCVLLIACANVAGSMLPRS
jgi:putative ABC transport system permease protein